MRTGFYWDHHARFHKKGFGKGAGKVLKKVHEIFTRVEQNLIPFGKGCCSSLTGVSFSLV